MPDTPTRTLVVGDLHGCLDELLDLLGAAGFDPRRDRLVSVGDLVGKGPAGAEVVRFFREGGHLAVRGNHDEKLLRHRTELVAGAPASLPETHARDGARLSERDWAWLAATPLTLDLGGGHLAVHAGLDPGVPLERQEPRVLMNLRSLRDDGQPTASLLGRPWASLWVGPPFVLFGHDARRGLQTYEWALGLDTGCVYGGRLTGAWLPERRVVQVEARRAYAEV